MAGYGLWSAEGTVQEATEKTRAGQLEPATVANVEGAGRRGIK